MSGRMFLNVVSQFKETSTARIGVIDSEGTVIACTDLQEIGKKWPQVVAPVNDAGDSCVVLEGKTFKALPGWGGQFDFAAYAEGEDEVSRTACAMAAIALNGAKNYYEEKHDRTSFVKNIISDNILLSDIYIRAKELHVEAELSRGVFVIRRKEERTESLSVDTVQNLLPDRQTGIVVSMGENDIVIIQQVEPEADTHDLEKMAVQIEEALRMGGESTVVIGIGTVANHLRDLAKSYKEAQIAIEVGKVFDTEKYIINYENLGIGRLIYQLPTTLCEMFLQEVFKKNPIDAL
ncbi:MAG: PucR family transcriptional regulator, partial [Oscillospiraceae bacterium]|nr:PucR family transcriptional regulator [Oscillospiraceae bacterium]